jgi:hypothetical protein
MNEHDTDVDRALRDLAQRVVVPVTTVADDLARGRRRVRRVRRAGVTAAALAVAAVIGVGASLSAGPETSTRPPANVDVATDPADPPEAVAIEAVPGPGVLPMPDRAERRELLRGYQLVLSEHLDPDGRHLQPYGASNGQQSVGGRGRLAGIGAKLSWTNPGESGLGMLQVFVSHGWDQQFDWYCGGRCRDVPAPEGAVSAQVHEHDGILEVGVERADGHVVVLSANPLFGNNSTVPVSGLDLTEQALLEAAADPRLALPGVLVPQPPPITAAQIREVLESSLDGPVSGMRTVGESARFVWAGSVQVHVSVYRTPGKDAADRTCPDFQLIRCTAVETDGGRVLVGEVRQKWGGGWLVVHTGPLQEVSVGVEDASLASGALRDQLLAVVTDRRLQSFSATPSP